MLDEQKCPGLSNQLIYSVVPRQGRVVPSRTIPGSAVPGSDIPGSAIPGSAVPDSNVLGSA
jgi:hypothetical protein